VAVGAYVIRSIAWYIRSILQRFKQNSLKLID